MGDSAGFFDQYPRFWAAPTRIGPRRSNFRYQALIEANLESVRGKRVLDIACQNGAWTFAALAAGAAQVTGIEARPEQVERAKAAMTDYSVSPQRYEFVVGDVHDVVGRLRVGSFDTIFCFGFLYHTMHHMALLSAFANLRPETIVIDSLVETDRRSVIRLAEEITTRAGNAVGNPGRNPDNRALVGTPSRLALEWMLRHVGYPTIEYYDWYGQGIEDWNHIEEYHDGRWVSLSAKPAAAGSAEEAHGER